MHAFATRTAFDCSASSLVKRWQYLASLNVALPSHLTLDLTLPLSFGCEVPLVCSLIQLLLYLLPPDKAVTKIAVAERVLLVVIPMSCVSVLLEMRLYLFGLQKSTGCMSSL